ALTPYLPSPPGDHTKAMAVYLLPGLTRCYGSTEGVQMFGLRAGADPEEALLFLTHVYYHEISSLFYTATPRRAEDDRSSLELFRHWLLQLIQDEGLANYAVLGPVLGLRARGRPFAYFTYAGLIHSAEATARAMSICRETIGPLAEDNFPELRG